MRRRAARTRSCPCRSSGPRGRRPARCNACTRSRRSRARGARSPAARAPRCRRRPRPSLQSASGFACQSSWRSSQPQLRGRGARRRLLAPHARDPAVEVGQRVPERADLADRAAEGRVARPERVAVDRGLAAERRPLVDLDLDPVALLDLRARRRRSRETARGCRARRRARRARSRAACRAAPTLPSGRSTRARASGGSARPSHRAPRAPQASPDRRRRRGPWMSVSIAREQYQEMRTRYSSHKSILQVGKGRLESCDGRAPRRACGA